MYNYSQNTNISRYVREGSDKTKGRDVCKYLGEQLSKSPDDIRVLISRHPNWCHVPLLAVREAVEYLRRENYSSDDIYDNLHIILYPVSRIADKLKSLQDKTNKIIAEASKLELTNSQMLGLCLYAIELEFHFGGDGIWTDPPEQHHTPDGMSTAMTDSLHAVYKNFNVKKKMLNLKQFASI